MLLSILYQCLWFIAPPFLRHYLRRRARLAPAYADHWAERFGRPYPQPLKNAIWVHAVSVGETRAAVPLVAALQAYFGDAPLLITQTTPTGRRTAEQLFPQAQCRYLPYDRRRYVAQFLHDHQPRFGIIMETEIWPNIMHACAGQQIPLFLANARLSAKSQRGYAKVRSLVRPALQTLSGCLAQTPADAQRLADIGAAHIHVCGSSKYDITPPEAMHALSQIWRQRIGRRNVVVCASTRHTPAADEAEMLLQAWQAYRGDALLVIIPRHPERFQATCAAAQALGYRVQQRSDNQAVAAQTQVWIGDSMGELFAYYLLADIAFVGGSLVDTGCHNIIEPMACGIPTLFGPSTYNFAATCQDALAAGAARQIASPAAWAALTQQLLADPAARQHMAVQAHAFMTRHQGASARMAATIAAIIGNQKKT